MVISDASEIQFTETGEDSFNTEQQGYTDDYCFHQKFLCSGLRRFQGYDEDGVERDYYLIAFDEEGEVLFNEQYIAEQEDPESPVIYSLEMTPSDESMCGKKVQFKIYDGPDPETDTELFYSDFIDFVSTWTNSPGSGRVDIQYRSIQNFADLIYDSESDYFMIQLEARFRKERRPTTQKSLELTEMVLNTAASVKRQRLLVIDDVPDYMHTKINLILAHAASGSVLINGKEWSVEEEYTEGERPGSYPLAPAEIWLTEKNYYKHNVI